MDEKKQAIDLSCSASEKFAKLFYETFDKSRHLLANLYLTNGSLIWNGASYQGKEQIAKFYESLPTGDVTLHSIDSQPVLNSFVLGQTTIMVTVSGSMNLKGKSNTFFTENFVLTAEGTVWKIVSDCMRFHEPVK